MNPSEPVNQTPRGTTAIRPRRALPSAPKETSTTITTITIRMMTKMLNADPTGGNALAAWDEQSGAFLWATEAFTPVNTFAVSDGVVVASDFFTANLYGFSTTDGSLIWTAAAGNSEVQRP